MHIIKIRYNHDAGESPLKWRILIDGREHLASDIEIHSPAYTSRDLIPGVGEKFHITCEAEQIEWVGDKIVLSNVKSKISKVRHLLKSFTYRVYSSCITSVIAMFITGSTKIGVSIGTADFIIKVFTYYIHERIWYRIPFGKEKIKRK
jgi:uncharacterized membrane protein